LHPTWLAEFEDEIEDADHEEFSLRWFALSVICLALFIGQTDVTVLNVALPTISTDLDASTSDLQWVMDSYAVMLAAFVLLGGGIADRFGRKRVFIAGFALFGAGGLAGSFSSDVAQLIVSRAVMGLGAALFFPPALSPITVHFRSGERARAVAIWAGVGGAATAFGPVLGEFWWRRSAGVRYC